MTDRELLELAAKAAGIEGLPVEQGGGWCLIRTKEKPLVWSPLSNDGDALRLAVKIGALIDIRYTAPEAIRYNRVTYWPTPYRGVDIEFGDRESDPLAATRRAIVRAAAAMGKAHPQGEVGK